MDGSTNLEEVLGVSIGKVNPRKLEQLKQKLEGALDIPLSSHQIDDPAIIRRLLVNKLQDEGASPGTIQSFEQLFMGIIRRAAIMGLLPAPPEGPWTRAWQSVLDISTKIQAKKSVLRLLASWATIHNISPNDINMELLSTWASETMINRNILPEIARALDEWSSINGDLYSGSPHLMDRLQRKALRGTVRSHV